VASWSKSSRAPPLRSTEVAGFTLRGDACQRFPSDRYHQPRSMHYWRMESPMLPDRLPGNRQYCLDKAVDCNRKAAQARDPNAAKEFHPSPHAGAWAATRDFNHKVEDIGPSGGRTIMMGLGIKRREFITGLRSPRAGRRGIRGSWFAILARSRAKAA
jgi:hypothetical protein